MIRRAWRREAGADGREVDGADILVVDHLSRSFGDVVALRDVSISIRRGEFVTLLGPSGCGKTTLLRVVAGFETVDHGRVLIDGADVLALPPERRPVNLVFQKYALFPHLTVWDNVAFGLRVAGVAERDVRVRVAESLEVVRLGDHGGRRIEELTGGQQQRVAVARALINRPSLLLLDEPLGALDLQLRKAMQAELRALQRQLGTTFLYVTHDQEEALTMSDTVVVMNRGEVAQVGSPEEVYRRPVSRFVAGFVGETNLLPGSCAEGRFELPGAQSSLPAPPGSPTGNAALSVRPEQMTLSGDGDSLLPGVVVDVIFSGPVTRHVVRLGDGTVIKVDEHGAELRELAPGDEVTVSWRSAECVVVPE
ncbi:MAG: spermidine/putrescine transport system ATP-binding protein [Gaiellales bacterium]|nr:spermidine/putrescine transport system ATP-binding protein [Gaiellales bacterium]